MKSAKRAFLPQGSNDAITLHNYIKSFFDYETEIFDFEGLLTFTPPEELPHIVHTLIFDYGMKNELFNNITFIPNNFLHISENISIKDRDSIRELDLENTKITSIGSNAFSNSFWLQEIILPKNLDYLGDYAFKNCKSLNFVDLSKCKELTEISKGCFENCGSLRLVKLPLSVNNIRANAFLGCQDYLQIQTYRNDAISVKRDDVDFITHCLSRKSLGSYYSSERVNQEDTIKYKDITLELSNVNLNEDELRTMANKASIYYDIELELIDNNVISISGNPFKVYIWLKEVLFKDEPNPEKTIIDLIPNFIDFITVDGE